MDWPAACTTVIRLRQVFGLRERSGERADREGVRRVPPLGEWLLGKTEADVERRYLEIGAQRAAQGVPVSQVVWMICLVRENLWDYLQKHAELERPAEIFGELELLEMLDQFFHRAIYYAALGHERASAGYR